MDVVEFREELIAQINAENDDPADRRESFLSEIVEGLIGMGLCEGFNPCYFEGSVANNKKVEIDGYFFDEDNVIEKTLSIFYCRYSGSDTPSVLTKTEIEKIYERAKTFVSGSIDGSLSKYIQGEGITWSTAKFIHECADSIQRFKFYIITDGSLSDRINGLDIEFINGIPTNVDVWDLNRYCSELENLRGNQDIVIDLEDYGYDGLSCVRANEVLKGAEYDAYLCVMPGDLLANIYSKYGSQLLEANVRSFLSVKGKVNKGIRDTIKNEPTKFFAYNNGISTMASDLTVEQTPEGPKITRIASLQIVNGGQTTASIYNATTGKNPVDVSDVYVPMKLCVIPPNAPDDFPRHISEYANSQNKVGKSDFFSNAPIHIKLEKISRRVVAPASQGAVHTTKWYYERARGSYVQATLGKSAAEVKAFQKENPKDQVITKTDFARYRNTIELRPFDVSKAPETNFVKFGEFADKLWESTLTKGSSVNDRYWKETVAVAILYETLVKTLRNKKLVPWMMSGEGKCLTSYSIAKLEHSLEKEGYTLNLEAIWNSQQAPDELINQLIEIAKAIRDRLQEEIEGSSKNLFDYCKSKSAWDIITPIKVELNKDIGRWVISKSRERAYGLSAKRSEHNSAVIADGIWVVERGEDFWKKVRDWGIQNKKLSSDDRSFLDVACEMNTRNKPPSERQCTRIRKIYMRLEDEGMELGY